MSTSAAATLRIETPRAFLPLLEPARYKGAYGGRDSGKSHFFASLLVEECIADPSTRAVCVREIQKDLSRSARQLVVDKIAKLGAAHHFEIPQDRTAEIHVLDRGQRRAGIISFQGMQNHTAESIKSLEGYRIAWVEEAQSLSQVSLNLLTPTIRPGEIWFSWNPKKATDPVDAFMRHPESAKDPNIICVQVNYNDNPWFTESGLREDMERDRRRDPDKYAHIWLGKYETKSEARVFRNWKVADEPFETPAGTRFYFGADWGFSVDPTVLVRCWIDGRTLYIDREAYKIGCEIDRTPELFQSIPESRKWQITADSARPETIDYMKRHGFPHIRPALKGPGSLEDGIEFLKSYDIVVHPDCTHCIDELSFYSWKQDPKTLEVLAELADKDNHCVDAIRYAVEGLRRSGGVPQISAETLTRFATKRVRAM